MRNAIGLMSGTSLDGVDVAWLRTDGEQIESFGPTGYRPYSAAERDVLRAALDAAPRIVRREERPAGVAAAEDLVTRVHAEAVESYLAANRIDRRTVDVVGFHGQTVLHRPHDRLTVQIGDGATLAKALKLPVVYDLRAADVAAGGQGAPLVPVYHRALARLADCAMPACIVNIGGVANVTYIDDDTLIACDTGPGNALLDDYLLRHTSEAMDRDGQIAAQGEPDSDWIAQALEHPFFDAPAPKSLDRNDFASFAVDGLSLEDGAATLTAFTAASIARIVDELPNQPASWIVTGGGANNPTLMRMLSEQLAPISVITGHDLGWQNDAVEAQAFAYLAVRSLKGLPLTYPGTTGVSAPLTGGVLVRP
ncbi:anhydro-N-acetylmuramic acid kinase [[Pseudomonas] carboxydohydrogena]|uniref:Anhydro-N-acetylmuramic acid kinase n=1 Tax=Afipia carboxydohydrogena TaxID=290 RepID=A0ABY8BKT9_AFICR|nr:anhydro-N-acetylmuramic acid kinase [[Pseudomonas] carboxydohydrogena]WEF50299.1 anhydro-N-acetylmuramic acid kinase [[Pseudomonas] carboxydohydrogena]